MADQILEVAAGTVLGSITERAVSASIDATGITAANPAVVDAAGHEFVAGDVVYFSGVGGMTEINDRYVTIASVNAGVDFTTDLDTSVGFTAHTTGGTATLAGVLAAGDDVQVIYDDAGTEADIVDALTRIREKVIELFSAR